MADDDGYVSLDTYMAVHFERFSLDGSGDIAGVLPDLVNLFWPLLNKDANAAADAISKAGRLKSASVLRGTLLSAALQTEDGPTLMDDMIDTTNRQAVSNLEKKFIEHPLMPDARQQQLRDKVEANRATMVEGLANFRAAASATPVTAFPPWMKQHHRSFAGKIVEYSNRSKEKDQEGKERGQSNEDRMIGWARSYFSEYTIVPSAFLLNSSKKRKNTSSVKVTRNQSGHEIGGNVKTEFDGLVIERTAASRVAGMENDNVRFMKDMTKVTQRLASLNERQAVLRNMFPTLPTASAAAAADAEGEAPPPLPVPVLEQGAEQGRCNVLSWLAKFDTESTTQNLQEIGEYVDKMKTAKRLAGHGSELPKLIAILESKSGASRLLEDIYKMDGAVSYIYGTGSNSVTVQSRDGYGTTLELPPAKELQVHYFNGVDARIDSSTTVTLHDLLKQSAKNLQSITNMSFLLDSAEYASQIETPKCFIEDGMGDSYHVNLPVVPGAVAEEAVKLQATINNFEKRMDSEELNFWIQKPPPEPVDEAAFADKMAARMEKRRLQQLQADSSA